MLESPCGSGKSTWAICHIALNAREDNRYLYVAETVDALYKTADVLEKLADTPVGRSHGFNPEKCRALRGVEHTWRDCLPKDPKSACRTCAQNNVWRSTTAPTSRRSDRVHDARRLDRAMEEDSEL